MKPKLTKINQNERKRKVWGKRETVHHVKHTTSSVKHCGGNVMAWAFMTASGTELLVITDDEH